VKGKKDVTRKDTPKAISLTLANSWIGNLRHNLRVRGLTACLVHELTVPRALSTVLNFRK